MRRIVVRVLLCLLLATVVASGCERLKAPATKGVDAEAAKYEGSVDGANYTSISGWVWKKNAPDESIDVEVYDGNTFVGKAKADRLREDLKKAGKGNGRHAFDLPTPDSLKDGKPHEISARVAGSGFKLREQPISITQSDFQSAGTQSRP